jgi:hypothetical protein
MVPKVTYESVEVPYQELLYGFEGKVIETASKAESPSKGGPPCPPWGVSEERAARSFGRTR